MKEIINLNEAKQIMKNLNVIIYGTIRNIEEHFLTSFTNLEIISSYFKNSFIIIFENDSTDNTRKLLQAWHQSKKTKINIKKHIILEENLDEKFPLRATRLAYCRNSILKYIFKNDLYYSYHYAIHCDLDNRFWCIDYESICNCFQYDLNKWDVMTCINKNKNYYDYWALRMENTWFDKNIFSCKSQNIHYETKTHEFIDLIKKTEGLLKTKSSFNGLGIYKLKSLKDCYYNASYHCKECNNTNRGCMEDNDHIGLHKQMTRNKCNIFINTKMILLSKPNNSLSYQDFIDAYFIKVPNLNKNPLLYVLKNEMVEKNGLWIQFISVIDEATNIISNYTEDLLYSFILQNKNSHVHHPLINHNVKIINGNFTTFNHFSLNHDVFKNKSISLLYLNNHSYLYSKKFLEIFIHKIKKNCIILFNNFINTNDYIIQNFKVFYEMVQEYKIDFEIIGINGDFQFKPTLKVMEENKNNHLFHYNSEKMIAIKILKNPFFKDDVFEKKSKPNLDENQLINLNEFIEFDWEIYVEINEDLKKNNRFHCFDDAWSHWINKGIYESRYYYVDWKKYTQDYNLDKKTNKIEAINHLIDNYKNQKNIYYKKIYFEKKNNKEISDKIIDHYKFLLFNWKYYLNKNNDLKNIKNEDEALNHFTNFGYKENRPFTDFHWIGYLFLNKDLITINLCSQEKAIKHWIENGKKENRKYKW